MTLTGQTNCLIVSTVNYATSNGTAVGGPNCTGFDYITTSGTLIFNTGETTKTFSVVLCSERYRREQRDGQSDAECTDRRRAGDAIDGCADDSNIGRTINKHDVQSYDDRSQAARVPYPSTITALERTGTRRRIAAYQPFDERHQFPDNIDVLLVGPQGQKFILMGDAGGPIPIATPGVTLTFIDTAGQVLPNNGPLTTGNFEPTNWETPVSSFAPPAPPAPYNEPGSAVGGTGLQTLNGNFFLANANGTWSLYVRDDGGQLLDPDVVVGSICGWGIQFLQTTAAGVSLSGRVTTAGGAGIRNANVVVTGNSLPEARTVTTGSFGYFSFEGLTAGETYVVTVNSQRYTFQLPSRVITLVDNLTDFDFTAEPNESR